MHLNSCISRELILCRAFNFCCAPLKRKCEEQGEVRKQGRGRDEVEQLCPLPLFVCFALFFTFLFKRVVGIFYTEMCTKIP